MGIDVSLRKERHQEKHRENAAPKSSLDPAKPIGPTPDSMWADQPIAVGCDTPARGHIRMRIKVWRIGARVSKRSSGQRSPRRVLHLSGCSLGVQRTRGVGGRRGKPCLCHWTGHGLKRHRLTIHRILTIQTNTSFLERIKHRCGSTPAHPTPARNAEMVAHGLDLVWITGPPTVFSA